MKFSAITKNIGDMLENMNKNLISLFLIIAFLYIGMVVYNSFIKKRSPTLLPNKPANTTTATATATTNDNESSENDLSYEKLTNDRCRTRCCSISCGYKRTSGPRETKY